MKIYVICDSKTGNTRMLEEVIRQRYAGNITENLQEADVVFVSESGIRTAEDIRKACESTADYILLDQGGGGTGKTFDWSLISGIERPFFLAGGLGIHNLSQAICQVHPWAVDLSGSLETDGYKDPEKIRRAVMLVREQTFSGILF